MVKMRLVEINECEYPRFKLIRRRLWADPKTTFGVITAEYASDLKIARFWFWDLAYIPENLREHMKVSSKFQVIDEEVSKLASDGA